MMWFFAILLVLLMGGVALVAAGRGAPLSEAYDDRPDALVPGEGDLGPSDLRRIRFTLAFRGYRMSEVDALLDRLALQIDQSGPPSEPAPELTEAARPAPQSPPESPPGSEVESPPESAVELDQPLGPPAP